MSDAEFASLRDMSTDELRFAVKLLDELESHPAWRYVEGLLVKQRAAQSMLQAQQPLARDTADSYALRQAHLAGYIGGLNYAAGAPQAVRRITERVFADQQEAAERAAREREMES